MKNPEKEEQRRLRLLQLINEQCGGVTAELARRINIPSSYARRMLFPAGKAGRKGISVHNIDAIEATFSLPKGWLDGVEMPDRHLAEILRIWPTLPQYKKIAALHVVEGLSLSNQCDTHNDGSISDQKKGLVGTELDPPPHPPPRPHKRLNRDRRQRDRRTDNRRHSCVH